MASSQSIRVCAPAKVNLFLEVLGKRADGYHEIVTVMQRVSLHDVLTFEPTESGIEITCTDPSIPTDRGNLVWRAVEALQQATGGRWGCRVAIDKRIPAGSGLGGGSSDAAATLRAVNELCSLGLDASALGRMATALGSDVPFFLGPPTAVCRGRGEILEPVTVAAPFHYVLVMSGLHVSTAEVYKRLALSLTARRKDVSILENALVAGDVERVGAHLFNRLETSAFAVHPELGERLSALARLGVCGARMSGSGSTLFALCRDARHAFDIQARARAEGSGFVAVAATEST